MEEELEHWGPGRICLRASMSPDKPNIMKDDRKEAEKWEHLEELRLCMKHVVGLMSDIVNNGLGQAFFVRTPYSHHFEFLIMLACSSPRALLLDLKETSRLKSGFIHATWGGWKQIPLLKDYLLESQEKLLKAYKDLTAALEEKKEKEAALTDAR